MRKGPLNKVTWRLDRVEPQWREVVNIIRQAAGESGYHGPSLELAQRIERDLGEVGAGLRDWGTALAIRRMRRPRSWREALAITDMASAKR